MANGFRAGVLFALYECSGVNLCEIPYSENRGSSVKTVILPVTINRMTKWL